MRQRGCTHASDKLQWGRQPGLLGRPAIPLGHPPTAPSLTPSPLTSSAWLRWEQPGLSAQVTPVWVGCRRPARPARPCPGLPAARHLQASAALPCSSPAPKQALGSSGGSGAPPPSRALRFFDIWSVFGSWVSPLSLSGEMSVCRERGRVWGRETQGGRERDWKKSLLKERGRDFGVAGEQVGGRD